MIKWAWPAVFGASDEIISYLSPVDGPVTGFGISDVLTLFTEHAPAFAGIFAKSTATVGITSWLSSAASFLTGISFTAVLVVTLKVIAVVVVAVVAAYLFAKALELIVPLLLNAGVAAAKLAGIALALAISWVLERISDIANAVVNAFNAAVDEAVRLGRLALDAANAVREAVSNAVSSFCASVREFFQNLVRGASNWIKGIFGSVTAAIAYAQDIVVTVSRIDEMQKRIGNLRQYYVDARNATNNANSIVSNVSGYYNESYVRSCCRDIQNDLKNAQKYIDTVERELDRKRRVLTDAVEAYRRSDQNGARDIRSATASFA